MSSKQNPYTTESVGKKAAGGCAVLLGISLMVCGFFGRLSPAQFGVAMVFGLLLVVFGVVRLRNTPKE